FFASLDATGLVARASPKNRAIRIAPPPNTKALPIGSSTASDNLFSHSGARMKTTCPHCWGSGTVADEQLSPNFRLFEFLRSDTARELGIPNVPTATHCIALRILTRELLQPLRDRFGPIRVTSGFRAPE